MALGAAFQSLSERLQELVEAVTALELTVSEDRPAENSSAFVDWLDDRVVELASSSEESLGYARKSAAAGDVRSDEARATIHRAHELLNRFTRRYAQECATHGTVENLMQMGRERGREWQAWSRVVKRAIEQCAEPLCGAHEALLTCWCELAEPRERGPAPSSRALVRAPTERNDGRGVAAGDNDWRDGEGVDHG